MPKSGTNVSIPTKLLATGVALALTLVVCATAATVMVSTDIVQKDDQTSAEPNVVLLERESFRDRGATAAFLDSLLAPLGNLGPAPQADVALMTAVFAARTSANASLETGAEHSNSAADVRFPAPRPTPPARALPLSYGLDSLTDAELAAATADTSSPWLPVFRRWARSKPLPALWSYRVGTPGVHSVDDLPARDFPTMRALFMMNEHAALFELKAGHATDAMNRARENLSASRHFIEQPLLYDALVGRIFTRRSAQLLAIAARRAGDEATTRNAMHLDSLASHSEGQSVLKWLLQEESKATAAAAEQVSANHGLHPALRVEAMQSIVMGGCRDVREVLFGFSTARREALLRSQNSVSDIPRGTELATLYINKFDAVLSDPAANTPPSLTPRITRLTALGPMQWMVPPGVRARVTWCTAWGY